MTDETLTLIRALNKAREAIAEAYGLARKGTNDPADPIVVRIAQVDDELFNLTDLVRARAKP